MNKNKYLLLASSLGVLALLVVAAAQENFFKEWRTVQRSASGEEGPIPVQLRQVVNPGLGVSDRCTSCHVGMSAGEQVAAGSGVLAPHKPVVHDPAEYGCTACHGGQGLATDKADAHGDVHFWPEPMIPVRYSYAGCGTCHIALGVPEQNRLRRASAVFERLDCLACHRLDGRGGTLRPDGGGMEGPDLSYTGIRGYDTAWYEKHLSEHQKAEKGPWKTAFAPHPAQDGELLAVFLATRIGASRLVEAKSVFLSTGCLGCHKTGGVGGDDGPDLARAGLKDPGQADFTHVPGKDTLGNWFTEHFRSPGAVVANSQMPIIWLGDSDVDLLSLYLFSLRRRDVPVSYAPKDRVRALQFAEREFAGDGATVYGAFCAGCHGPDGRGWRSPGMPAFPSVAGADLLELASDEFLAETVRRGRPGRRMPAWGEMSGGLRPEEIRAVVSHLRQLGGVQARPDTSPRRWVQGELAAGQRLYAAACEGCHGAKGEGGEGPALNNKILLATASDRFLVETIGRGRAGTSMPGFRKPSPAHPTLAEAEIASIVVFLRSWEGARNEK